jgi:hypothetical protein
VNPYKTYPGFGLRVAYAAKMLRLLAQGKHETYDPQWGWESCVDSRRFDNCFEMHDSDAVVWALMHNAKSDPVLKGGIELFANTPNCMALWVQTAEGPQIDLFAETV